MPIPKPPGNNYTLPTQSGSNDVPMSPSSANPSLVQFNILVAKSSFNTFPLLSTTPNSISNIWSVSSVQSPFNHLFQTSEQNGRKDHLPCTMHVRYDHLIARWTIFAIVFLSFSLGHEFCGQPCNSDNFNQEFMHNIYVQ